MSVSTVFWPSFTAVWMRRKMAVRLARASKQPLLPQPHLGPPTSRTMCPISPAVRLKPLNRRPSRMMPAPMPVPRKMPTMWRGLPAEFGDVHAEGAGVAVVLDEDGDVELLFQFLLEVDVLPAGHVGGEDHPAFLGIDRAGGADADGLDLFEILVGFVDGVADRAGDAFDHRLGAAVGLGAGLGGGDQLQLGVEHAGEDLGAAEVDADKELLGAAFGHDDGDLGQTVIRRRSRANRANRRAGTRKAR
jgi:hypothetical protein